MSSSSKLEHVAMEEFYNKQGWWGRLRLRFTSIGCVFRSFYRRGWSDALREISKETKTNGKETGKK